MAAACGAGGENVLYGWGKNAPSIHLPDKTGFSVGPGSGIRSVVLQVHYLQLRIDDDASGVQLHLTPEPVPYSAGLIAFAAGFSIPAGESDYPVTNECCYSGFEELTGFAFRVHTHSLGKKVSLDQTIPKETSKRKRKFGTTTVAEQDPQLPQGFYPIDNNKEIKIFPGDRIKATCAFDSSSMTTAVHAGHTSSDEMCNFYLMVYSELPFFMWCVDGNEWIHAHGAGGMPEVGEAVVEHEYWKPPSLIDSVTMPALEKDAHDEIKMELGQISGVTLGSNNTIWAFHRAFRVWSQNSFNSENKFTKEAMRWPAVLKMDRDSGSVLSAWGEDTFFMPHMISVTPEGDIWVVDTGRHQIMKFSSTGEELMVLGEKLIPGSSTSPLQFCKPTHVVTARDGTIYVADGYCNSRIVVLSPRGEFVEAWELPRGPKDVVPDPLPHSLALDECRNRLYVADREVGHILAFDLKSGEVKGQWTLAQQYGLPYAVQMGPYGAPIVLTWDRDGTGAAKLVVLTTAIGDVAASYDLPGVDSPHDFTLVPAPLELTGAGERVIAVVVAETAPRGSKLRKFVLLSSQDEEQAAAAELHSDDVTQDQPAGLAASHAGHAMLKPVGGGKESSSSNGGGGSDDEEEKKKVGTVEDDLTVYNSKAVEEEQLPVQVDANDGLMVLADGSAVAFARPPPPSPPPSPPRPPAPPSPPSPPPSPPFKSYYDDDYYGVEELSWYEMLIEFAALHPIKFFFVSFCVIVLIDYGWKFASTAFTRAQGYREPEHVA